MERKHIAIILLVFGLLLLFAGFAAGKSSDSYKGLKASTGYIDSTGKMVTLDSGVIGRNQTAVDYYGTIRTACYIAGIGALLTALFLFVQSVALQASPSTFKTGIVEMADGNTKRYMIRFDNEGVSTFKAAANVMLIQGDTGEFEIKKDTVVSFKRINYSETD